MSTVNQTAAALRGKNLKDPPSVLIAEDNLINQKLMSLLFSKLNLEVDLVCNGSDAVKAALSKHYDVILMDIQMPGMDGVEACTQIKGSIEANSPIIIALTANAMHGDREKFMDCGMDHYLSKPVDFEDIVKVLAHYTGFQAT